MVQKMTFEMDIKLRLWIKIYTISFQIIYCCAVVHQTWCDTKNLK